MTRFGLRVLFIDDRVPHDRLGSGFPRSREMLSALVTLGHRVTFYPSSFPEEDWDSVYADVPREVEVALGAGRRGLAGFLRERRGLFDVVLVSRPHNMEWLREVLAAEAAGVDPAPIVYDAEAMWCLREVGRRALKGTPPSVLEVEALVAEETRLAEGTAAVISVSEREGELFRSAGVGRVFVLGHALEAAPTPAAFEERSGILFVGAIHEDASPNADSVVWFASDVLPLVREALGMAVPFRIVGLNRSPRVARLSRAGSGIELVGPVDDVAPEYDRARLFVAPTRFAAGIPLKAYHAAAHGVPIMTTPLVAAHLGWEPGRDLLVGDGAQALALRCAEAYRDPQLWRRLRDGALSRIRAQCSRTEFRDRLAAILREAVGAAPSERLEA